MTYDQPTPVYAPPPAVRPKPRWPWIAVALAVLVAGFGAYLALGRDSGPTLTAAEQECNDGRTDARVSDGGKTLIITTSPDAIKEIVDVQTVNCVLDHLETPAAVREHIRTTRALDGRQTDSWGAFTAAWTYHPDNGLDITIEAK